MYLFSLVRFPSPTKSKDPDKRAIIHLPFTHLFTIHPSFHPLFHSLIHPSSKKYLLSIFHVQKTLLDPSIKVRIVVNHSF